METSVQAAVNAGLLVRNSDGSYSDVGQQQLEAEYKAEADRKAETSTKEPTVAPLDDASESLMQTFVQNVHPTDGALAVKNIIEGEEISEETIARAASRLGTEPAIVRQQVAQLQTAFENQARDYVGDRVLDYARQHDMEGLKEAARMQAMTGSIEGYKAIAQRHMAGLDKTDPQSILTSNDGKRLNARLNKSTGEVVLDIPGVGSTSWGAAIRAGLIQPYSPLLAVVGSPDDADLFPASYLPPASPSSPSTASPRATRPRRSRMAEGKVTRWFKDERANAIADWLAHNYRIDQLLGIEPTADRWPYCDYKAHAVEVLLTKLATLYPSPN
jgi:hypothetical protein